MVASPLLTSMQPTLSEDSHRASGSCNCSGEIFRASCGGRTGSGTSRLADPVGPRDGGAPAGSMPLTRAGQASASPFRAYRALTDAAGSCGWAVAWTEIASGNAYCFGRSCAAPSTTVRSNASRSARNAMAPSPSTPRCRHAKRTRSSAADRTRNSLPSPAHIRQPRTCYGGPQLARKPCSCIGIVKWVGRLRGTVQTACL